MKDYYQILGIPENSSDAVIRKAFRKLAFQYHPDTNPGHEQEAARKFKEINEAYGVLGDQEKRRQYDLARKGVFAGVGYDQGYQGFDYSQQDIFRDIFSNRAMVDELNRMFARAGLRFDQDFLNRVFFSGNGVLFQFFAGPGGTGTRNAYRGSAYPAVRQPGLLERWLSRVAMKVGRFVLKTLFGFPDSPSTGQQLDHHVDFELSPSEAASGVEKLVTYQRNGQAKRLMVKVPSGVRQGTRIRLKGMGVVTGNRAGNLYLHIRIKR